MKTKRWTWIVVAALVMGCIAAWWMLRPTSKTPTVSNGQLERFNNFESQFVDPRTISVWLPPGYQKGDPCDVLYMHDGQMLFDATTTWNGQEWRVDEIASQLIGDSVIRRCIVVGIDNTDKRLEEYFPEKAWQQLPADIRGNVDVDKALGDDYLRFVVDEVKPFVDKRYHPLTTREHTFMMGSSMGGLISLYALCEYPQVFGGAACLSTHLSFDHLPMSASSEQWAAAFRDYVDTHLPPCNGHLVYMDHGTEDFDAKYTPYQNRIDSVFIAHAWDSTHYQSLTFDGHEHKEIFWAKRLEHPLLFLLGSE